MPDSKCASYVFGTVVPSHIRCTSVTHPAAWDHHAQVITVCKLSGSCPGFVVAIPSNGGRSSDVCCVVESKDNKAQRVGMVDGKKEAQQISFVIECVLVMSFPLFHSLQSWICFSVFPGLNAEIMTRTPSSRVIFSWISVNRNHPRPPHFQTLAVAVKIQQNLFWEFFTWFFLFVHFLLPESAFGTFCLQTSHERFGMAKAQHGNQMIGDYVVSTSLLHWNLTWYW